ncbi:chitin-binding protein [Micromonospora sp. KC606]|uniref:lytic polysaccharide monooxygenase auxiliary activity family 9 protein n=1 Tax=Micromonospora sp. KC606 TaxID=2530379 RepID=UPI00104DD943|nr:lytic polysaccharide monooxygenase [Micromonospora sp. KC606]TDC81191.1 chitin-binding protein [Micromonospora sp. KC606]
MKPVRRVLAVVAVCAATVLPTAAPAAAHGAATSPVSRNAACGPAGEHASTPACRAALKAGAALREWDNIRQYGVAGRDREKIPDGELCSGGLSAYRGLDLTREDWPATEVTAGAGFAFRYAGTIPHEGTFRLYATLPGYDPRKRLTWADLSERPFVTVTDPPLRKGAYEFTGRLPVGLTGRHLIYTVWQNSDSADTYYSCSDVDFVEPTAESPTTDVTASQVLAGPPGSAGVPEPTAVPTGTTEPVVTEAGGVPVAAVSRLRDDTYLMASGAAAGTVLLAAIVVLRLRRPSAPPPGRPCGVRNHRAGRRRVW